MSDTNRTPDLNAPTTSNQDTSLHTKADKEQQEMSARRADQVTKTDQTSDVQRAQDAQTAADANTPDVQDTPGVQKTPDVQGDLDTQSTKRDADGSQDAHSVQDPRDSQDAQSVQDLSSSQSSQGARGNQDAQPVQDPREERAIPDSQRTHDNMQRAQSEDAGAPSPGANIPLTKTPPDTTLPRPIPFKMLNGSAEAPLTKKELAQKKKKIPLTWHSRTEVGHVRDHNEDSYLVQPPLFAVADGMGGHEAGEVASSIAVSTISQLAPHTANASQLGAAVEKANEAVISAAEAGEGRVGMGTTCTAAIIVDNQLAIAHVGDSRAYLLHNGTLIRITHDHSFVEELVEKGEITADEARNHPNRSIITRALGSDRNMYADHFSLTVEEGDRILLCTDGLSSMLTDALIEDIMVSSPHPKECVDDLIEAALRAGGLDNVTALVIDVANDGAQKKRRRHTAKNVVLWVVSVLAALAIVAGGVALYAQNSWFVVDEGGFVVVYRGLPGTIGPFSLNELENKTTIKTADLATSTAKRLQEGVQMSSRESVDQLLQSYRQQIDDDLRQKAEQAGKLSSSPGTAQTGIESTEPAQNRSGDITHDNTVAPSVNNEAPTYSGAQHTGAASSIGGGESR